jgi:hypothetical protein
LLFRTVETCSKKQTDISVIVIDHHISQWDVIPKDTVPVVVYQCETWSIIFGEEHRLRIFEKRVLKISGAKKEFQETEENCLLSSFHS